MLLYSIEFIDDILKDIHIKIYKDFCIANKIDYQLRYLSTFKGKITLSPFYDYDEFEKPPTLQKIVFQTMTITIF